jgi:hypothetical protein
MALRNLDGACGVGVGQADNLDTALPVRGQVGEIRDRAGADERDRSPVRLGNLDRARARDGLEEIDHRTGSKP